MDSLAHQPKIHRNIHSKKPSLDYKPKPMECETLSTTRAPQDPPLAASLASSQCRQRKNRTWLHVELSEVNSPQKGQSLSKRQKEQVSKSMWARCKGRSAYEQWGSNYQLVIGMLNRWLKKIYCLKLLWATRTSESKAGL